MRALAILVPAAQDKDLDLLKATGLQVEHWDITDSRSAADLAVVLVGDGTIHRFLPQLLRAKLPVLLVPYGSGNDLARSLSISSAQISTDLARKFVAQQAAIREIDVG